MARGVGVRGFQAFFFEVEGLGCLEPWVRVFMIWAPGFGA